MCFGLYLNVQYLNVSKIQYANTTKSIKMCE